MIKGDHNCILYLLFHSSHSFRTSIATAVEFCSNFLRFASHTYPYFSLSLIHLFSSLSLRSFALKHTVLVPIFSPRARRLPYLRLSYFRLCINERFPTSFFWSKRKCWYTCCTECACCCFARSIWTNIKNRPRHARQQINRKQNESFRFLTYHCYCYCYFISSFSDGDDAYLISI